MREIMDWAGNKSAVVTISQFGNFRDIMFDMDNAEGVRAVHDFMENRMLGGRAYIHLKCGCDFTYNVRGTMISCNVCDDHAE